MQVLMTESSRRSLIEAIPELSCAEAAIFRLPLDGTVEPFAGLVIDTDGGIESIIVNVALVVAVRVGLVVLWPCSENE